MLQAFVEITYRMADAASIVTETGVQLLSRLQRRRCLNQLEPALLAPECFQAGTVVRVSGEANCGKSELLLHLVRKCIVPVDCGGMEVEVVYLDNDRHLSLTRLIGLLEEHFKLIEAPGRDLDTFVRDCLSRLNLINGCADSGQFLVTLQYIDSFYGAPKSGCSVLMVDSISAFYYEDRMLLSDSLSRLDAHHEHVAGLLETLTAKRGFTVIYTRQDLMNSRDFNFMGGALEKVTSWKVNLSGDGGADGEFTAEVRLKNDDCWENSFNVFGDGIRFKKKLKKVTSGWIDGNF